VTDGTAEDAGLTFPANLFGATPQPTPAYLSQFLVLSFAKTLRGHKSRPVTMLQARPHAIHFKRILDFGVGQG
jgi:hypothetical protein